MHLSLCIFRDLRYSSKYFAQIYRAYYGAAVLIYLRAKPTLRLEISVNFWNLPWLARRLIICTEQTSIYISTFPNTLTSEWAKTSRYVHVFRQTRSWLYVTHRHNTEIRMPRLLEKRKKSNNNSKG